MGQFNTIPPNPFPPSSESAGSGGSSYVLPVASAETLGGVKVGNNLSINDGVLSAPAPYVPPSYSSDETDTGAKWINGNNIYRKVITFQSDLTVSYNSWTSTSDAISDISTLISAQGIYDDACYPLMGSFNSSGVLSVLACRADSSVDVKKIIVEYTKTPASE